MSPKGFDKTIGIAFVGFIMLGLPVGLLGTAWPSIRELYNLPQAAVGAFLALETVGYISSSFSSGAVINRFGIGKSLFFAYLIRGVGLSLIFVAPSWHVMLMLAIVSGIGGGIIDAGLNTYVAGYNSNRLMNWLHAFFGVGLTLGPLFMTLVFELDAAWQWGYIFAGSTQFLLAAIFFVTLPQWKQAFTQETEEEKSISLIKTLSKPIVWISVTMFAFYTGLELGAGQWAFSLFTEARGMPATQASLWVSIYWASFTVGRFFFGVIGDSIADLLQIRACLVGILTGSALIWINGNPFIAGMGLIVFGFSLAPIFALLINATPRRVGAEHAANAIGFQISGASIGVTLFPWLIGLFAEYNETHYILVEKLPILDTTSLTYNLGLEIVAPCLFAIAMGMFVIHEVLIFIVSASAKERSI